MFSEEADHNLAFIMGVAVAGLVAVIIVVTVVVCCRRSRAKARAKARASVTHSQDNLDMTDDSGRLETIGSVSEGVDNPALSDCDSTFSERPPPQVPTWNEGTAPTAPREIAPPSYAEAVSQSTQPQAEMNVYL